MQVLKRLKKETKSMYLVAVRVGTWYNEGRRQFNKIITSHGYANNKAAARSSAGNMSSSSRIIIKYNKPLTRSHSLGFIIPHLHSK